MEAAVSWSEAVRMPVLSANHDILAEDRLFAVRASESSRLWRSFEDSVHCLAEGALSVQR